MRFCIYYKKTQIALTRKNVRVYYIHYNNLSAPSPFPALRHQPAGIYGWMIYLIYIVYKYLQNLIQA